MGTLGAGIPATVLEHSLHRDRLVVVVRTLVPLQLLVHLVGALQVGVVHPLVRHAVVFFVTFHVENFVESFKQVLVVFQLYFFVRQNYLALAQLTQVIRHLRQYHVSQLEDGGCRVNDNRFADWLPLRRYNVHLDVDLSLGDIQLEPYRLFLLRGNRVTHRVVFTMMAEPQVINFNVLLQQDVLEGDEHGTRWDGPTFLDILLDVLYAVTIRLYLRRIENAKPFILNNNLGLLFRCL